MRTLSRLAAALLPLVLSCGPALPPPSATVLIAAPPAPPPPSACERGTARVLDRLGAPLDVTVWVTRGTPTLDAFAAALDQLFTDYERLAPGKLRHTVVEGTSEADRAKAKNDGVDEQVFGEAKGATARLFRGFMGVSFKYRSTQDSIRLFDPEGPGGVAYWIARKIHEVRARADGTFDKIGVLTGKEGVSLSAPNLVAIQGRSRGPNMREVMEQAMSFYKFQDVDLQGGGAEIDPELTGLLITQPGRDFTDPELRRIDDFLLRGKSIAVFAGAANMKESDPGMRADLHTHGLERLLAGYGIELHRDVIFDGAHPAALQLLVQGAPVKLSFPGIPLVQANPREGERTRSLDAAFPAFFRLEEVVFPFPSTLVLHPERQPGARLRAVAHTSSRSTVFTGATVDLKPGHEPKPQGEAAQRTVAVALEGKVKSAFGAPVRRPEPGEGSRLLVVASPQFLANPFARAGNPLPTPPQSPPGQGDEELMMISQPYAQQYLTSTILVFKDTLDWMTSSDDLLACSTVVLGK